MQTILIVEDKESMSQMLSETLAAEGYRVIIAADGQKGIRCIREHHLDLVLSDLKLPKKDGMEVLKAVKAEKPLLPVIMMTAYGTVETAVEAMKVGAFDFITKPFDTDHLLHLIRKAIENQRLIAENTLLKEEFSSLIGTPKIIGKSEGITEVAKKIQKDPSCFLVPAKDSMPLFIYCCCLALLGRSVPATTF